MKRDLKYAKTVNGQPMYFLDKIRAGIKKHTVRRDKKHSERLKKYSDINYPVEINNTYNEELPSYLAKVADSVKTTATGIEPISIEYIPPTSEEHSIHGYTPIITIGSRVLSKREAFMFALNDGFNAWESFCDWFDKDYTGVIIHFTNMRYEERELSGAASK